MADQFDYLESRADADELIEEHGGAAKLVVPGATTGPAYNPTVGEPTRHDCMVAVIDYSDRQIDGTRILATDQRGLMSVGTLAVVPDPTHKLELLDGSGNVRETLTIIRVKRLAPAGVTVLYDLQLRRA